ncbi:hypothetical protein CVT25_007294 [Psilocybe cyanescens]|uniref:DUF2415 domain-containing protein n=1 Tax=Psilocybe cyanescens TaxID=93625 RepID=A0A409XPA0_PSICY|nr:hypothetical protein CVT25_007294 [Psilocybe cyanescens]
MARDPFLLDSNSPLAIAPAAPTIAHVQLRDLLICPRERGVVNYVVNKGIAEQDMHSPGTPTRILSKLGFTPNSLTSLPVGVDDTLIAAGGQDRELHLSYYTPSSTSSSRSSGTGTLKSRPPRTRRVWESEDRLIGSINNSVLLTSLSLTGSHQSSVEPRVVISNNDWSIRMYDIPMRVRGPRTLKPVGELKLDVAINHSSISPDGRTLLSVGDSSKIYFHQITGGAHISFTPIHTLAIPPPEHSPLSAFHSASLAAAFSTAFSGDGSKFAVASQEGVVAVWDVRSSRPMRVWQTDKTRGMGLGAGGGAGNGGATGWLTDDPWDWTRGTKAPGWCVRSVKFNSGEGARMGKEVMAFTEHTSLVHVVDARTFETHDIIPVPTLSNPPPPLSSTSHRVQTQTHTGARTRSRPRSASISQPRPDAVGNTAAARRNARILMRRGLPVSNARSGEIRAEVGTGAAGENASASVSGSGGDSRSRSETGRRAALDRRMTAPTSGNGSSTATAPSPLRRSSTASTSASGSGSGSTTAGQHHHHHQPGIVQALGDAFRIPLPPNSIPASASASAPYSLHPYAAHGHSRAHVHAPYQHPQAAASFPRGHPYPHAPAHAPSPPPMARSNATSGTARSPTAPAPAAGTTRTAGGYSPPASIGDSTWRTLGWGVLGPGMTLRGWSAPAAAEETAAAAAAENVRSGVGEDDERMRDADWVGPPTEHQRAPEWDRHASMAPPLPVPTQVPMLMSTRAHALELVQNGRRPQVQARFEEYDRSWARSAAEHEEGQEEGEGGQQGASADEDENEEREGDDTEGEAEEGEGIVVVPDLGDRDVESEVHALLAGHGIPSRLSSGAAGERRIVVEEEEEEEDSMDVDVEEEDDEIAVDEDEDEEDEEEEDRVEVDDDDEDRYHPPRYHNDVEREEDDEEEELEQDGVDFECVSGDSRSGSPTVAGVRGRRIRQGGQGRIPASSINSNTNANATWTMGSIFSSNSRSGFNTASMSARYGSSERSSSSLSSSSGGAGGWGEEGWPGVRYGGLESSSSSSSSSALNAADNDKRLGGGTNGIGSDRRGGGNGRGGKGKAGSGRKYGYYDDLDIAGMCFDPWGEKMYVLGVGAGAGAGMGMGHGGGGYGGAYGHGHPYSNGGWGTGEGEAGVGVGAVVEWSVRGAEKRWWVDEGWM